MTEIIVAGPEGIARAAEMLRAGSLVAFGTETVYGLGADAADAMAVARIYAAKERPSFNPLICHYPSDDDAFADVEPDSRAQLLAAELWPGPLTLVLPRRPGSRVASIAAAGLPTLAVRVPGHRDALILLAAVNRPVAAPSANRSGQISPSRAAHVMDGLGGRIAAILDSGPCRVGLESTVLDLSGRQAILLRPGGITVETIEALIGPIRRKAPPAGAAPRSPGQLASHYAPDLPLRLNATSFAADEALLAFGPHLEGGRATYQLSERGNVTEAAARLFDGLHWLDSEGRRLGLRGIAVMPVPSTGTGLAINDRLERAAAPRGGGVSGER